MLQAEFAACFIAPFELEVESVHITTAHVSHTFGCVRPRCCQRGSCEARQRTCSLHCRRVEQSRAITMSKTIAKAPLASSGGTGTGVQLSTVCWPADECWQLCTAWERHKAMNLLNLGGCGSCEAYYEVRGPSSACTGRRPMVLLPRTVVAMPAGTAIHPTGAGMQVRAQLFLR